MDLGTVRFNVERGRWVRGEDVFEACHLVFANAITYNGASRPYQLFFIFPVCVPRHAYKKVGVFKRWAVFACC